MGKKQSDRLIGNEINKSENQNILPGTNSHTQGYDTTTGGFKGKVRKYKWWIVGGVAVLVLVAIILALSLKKGDDSGGGDKPQPGPTPGPVPDNYNPYIVQPGSMVNQEQKITGFLELSESKLQSLADLNSFAADQYKADPRQIPKGANNVLMTNVSFEFGQASYKVSYLELSDANNQRYSIPNDMVNKPKDNADVSQYRLEMVGFQLMTDPFGFKFINDRNNKVLISTEKSSFVMMDKYMQLDLQLPSRRIYGLGERVREFSLGEGTWTMWANGQETPYDDGSGGHQTYGVHPFALVQTQVKGEYFGLFFRSSNAMSPVLRYTGNDEAQLSYITTGGQIEIYFFFMGSAKDIIRQYHQFIAGRPTLPPLWSLGWHAAAYAYITEEDVRDNVQKYAEGDFPLEGVWLDINYMDAYADFSVNATGYPTIKEFTKEIQANHQRMVLIVDAGISADDPNNDYYSDALQKDLLLRSTHNPEDRHGILTQHVWPNHTVFLDFLNEETKDIWARGLKALHDLIPYDGLWLDMNEATGFCNGECPSGVVPQPELPHVDNHTWWTSYSDQAGASTYELPFIPGGTYNLDNMSISLNATHPQSGLREYDTHSLFGHSEGKMTKEILEDKTLSPLPDKRIFLLSRSTFAGSGQYVQHWLGDNHRTWQQMQHSISGIMNFNMFGIPLVGPDTCGFFGHEGQDEICGRWMQLAQFFPFARQHRDISGGGPPNEPYNLQEPYKTMARAALHARLQYTRLLYTCLFEVSQDGGTCYDPLMFHYPHDDTVFQSNNTENSFIFANAIKVTPVLTEGAQEVWSYFPQEAAPWVSLNDLTKTVDSSQGGTWVKLPAPASKSNETIPAHLKPGALIPFQNNADWTFKTTYDLIQNGTFDILVNRDEQGHAQGKVFLDHGETLSELENKEYEYYDFRFQAKSLQKLILNEEAKQSSGLHLRQLIITNAEDLKDSDFACLTTEATFEVQPLKGSYDGPTHTFRLAKEDGSAIDLFQMKNIYFGKIGQDVNHCSIGSNYYRVKAGQTPDLSGPSTSFLLESQTPNALRDLKMTLSVLATGTINVNWNYANMTGVEKEPFEVPLSIVDPQKHLIDKDAKLSDFITLVNQEGQPFSLTVNNANSNPVYTLNGMVLSSYYNEISSTAHTNTDIYRGIMGLGEQTSNDLFLADGVYSLWARDVPNPEQDGKLPGKNLYGTHPFFMAKATDKTWFGVFTNLAAAQDWWITNHADNGLVDIRTIAAGGVGDLYFMLGSDPEDVATRYHTIVGKPVLTPQWALGWHQCRWGYKTTDLLRQVVHNYSEYELPLDTQWSDIDYLATYKDFTYDPERFSGLGQFVSELLEKGIHYIPILDAGVAQREDQGYTPYDSGKDQGVFLKTKEGEVFTGQVWADDAAFPDFLAANTPAWWGQMLTDFHNAVPFSGLWEDMNEASNFCTGACYRNQVAERPVKDRLPYIPTGRDLEEKSIALDAVHEGGFTELDAHSLYGTAEVAATHQWFQENDKRTMIIERSAYAGLGKFGSRWLGDNFSDIKYLGYSITGIMAHNVLGIPLAGSDICGFIGNTTAELCARWYVAGAFYPFSRNHNGWTYIAQEPWEFKGIRYEASTDYFDIIQMAMRTKLHLIRYYYTQITNLHIDGGTFFRPVFWDFPDEAGAYQDLPNNVMLGSALKLSVLTTALNQNTTDFFFPAGVWCQVFNTDGTNGCITQTTAGNVSLPSKAYDFHLHLLEGHIVPLQEATALAKAHQANTTKDLQAAPIQLHILPACANSKCSASGSMLNDDGLVLKDFEKKHNLYQFIFNWDQSTTAFTLAFAMPSKTQEYADAHINSNDILNGVEIYHAQALGLATGTYQVTAQIPGGSDVPLGAATYNAISDRLTLNLDATTQQWMTGLTSLTFTKS